MKTKTLLALSLLALTGVFLSVSHAADAVREVVITAPARAGSYPFLRTFPGHFTTMKGTLIVK